MLHKGFETLDSVFKDTLQKSQVLVKCRVIQKGGSETINTASVGYLSGGRSHFQSSQLYALADSYHQKTATTFHALINVF